MPNLVSVRSLFGALGLALAWLPAVVLADARASFRAGVQHSDKGAWDEAAVALRQALHEDPKETGEPVRIYGMRYENYRPHYYLAKALVRGGAHSAAREVLDRLVRQGPQSRLATAQVRFLYQQCNVALGVRREQPASGVAAASPSVLSLPAPSVTPDPPPARCTGSPQEVHTCALQTTVEEAEGWLGQASDWLAKLESQSQRDPSRFAREPARGTLQAAKDLLAAARFRLAACRLEGDLEGARTARDDAQVATEELEALFRAR